MRRTPSVVPPCTGWLNAESRRPRWRLWLPRPTRGVYQDNNDTWLITDGHLIVVINTNGWIVTGIERQM